VKTLKAYFDLTRLHFFFVWPTLFCSGLFLAFQNYGGFSYLTTLKAVLIGFLGFEAGFILNDYVDRELDKKDVEFDKMKKYWRLFRIKPISEGLISPDNALKLFLLLVALTTILILTFPYPHSLYVIIIMGYCYCSEYFYQVKKRNQSFPFAQLLGRTDFTMFPVAGYLLIANPDATALSYALFFYPFAIAHLGLNDIIDVVNDEARGMKTISVLYGMKGTSYWILLFTAIHFVTAILFMNFLGQIAKIGIITGMSFLGFANYIVLKGKSSQAGLKALPFFHVGMLIYASSMILDYVI